MKMATSIRLPKIGDIVFLIIFIAILLPESCARNTTTVVPVVPATNSSLQYSSPSPTTNAPSATNSTSPTSSSSPITTNVPATTSTSPKSSSPITNVPATTSTSPNTSPSPTTNIPAINSPTPSSSPITNNPQTTQTKDILDVTTEVVYTDVINEEGRPAETSNQTLTDQLGITDNVNQTTQITNLSSLPTRVITNAVTTPHTTVSKPTKTVSTEQTPLASSRTIPTTSTTLTETTTLAKNTPITSPSNNALTHNLTETTSTRNAPIKSDSATPHILTTLNPISSPKTTSVNQVVSNQQTEANPSINGTTLIATNSTLTLSNLTTTLSPISSYLTTSPSKPDVRSGTTTNNAIISSLPPTTTFMNSVSETNTPMPTNKTQTTESERFLSSTTRETSKSTSNISNNSTGNVNTVTVSELVNTSTASINNSSGGSTDIFETFTTVIYEVLTSSTTYVEDNKDTGDLPLLLIMISSTVGILVTLLVVIFAAFICVTYKRRQRRHAKYYDYKKRWVKRAPRPKYEKVKQNYRHNNGDREAAGSGWVFQDATTADPSKQITLELKPRNSQALPEDIMVNNGKLKPPLNFGVALSTGGDETDFPPDVLSSSSQEGVIDFDDVRSSLRLSKGSERADCSSRSSEGDSGILALGDDLWSPTKGVPFHFISDDAVIEL